MTLLPRSLFGRLVLFMMGGLVVAQLLSAYINYAERDRMMFRASGMRSAQRIADIVRLLDPMDRAEREKIVAILNAPPLFVALDRDPIAAEPIASDDGARAAFAAALRGALASDRAVRIGREAARPAWAKGPFREREWERETKRPRPRGAFFLTQVALADGTWVTFDAFVPPTAPTITWRLVGSLAVLLAATLALAWLAVGWITRPINVLATAAERLGEDIRRPPLAEAGPSEVRRAAHAFNRMQSRLVHLIDERSRVLAAMSHDLKTPLTRMRLRAELLEDPAVRQKFEKDLAEMESMVAQTLDYLRGMESRIERQPIDIGALVESLQADYAEMGHDVQMAGGASAPYPGDLQLLRRAITNLVDNAIKYGARAEIRMEDTAGGLVLRVLDHGPGLAPAELERVFEPFYRIEASRNRATGGTGLGLSIARAIALAHGGTVTLANRPEGGLEATLRLPR